MQSQSLLAVFCLLISLSGARAEEPADPGWGPPEVAAASALARAEAAPLRTAAGRARPADSRLEVVESAASGGWANSPGARFASTRRWPWRSGSRPDAALRRASATARSAYSPKRARDECPRDRSRRRRTRARWSPRGRRGAASKGEDSGERGACASRRIRRAIHVFRRYRLAAVPVRLSRGCLAATTSHLDG